MAGVWPLPVTKGPFRVVIWEVGTARPLISQLGAAARLTERAVPGTKSPHLESNALFDFQQGALLTAANLFVQGRSGWLFTPADDIGRSQSRCRKSDCLLEERLRSNGWIYGVAGFGRTPKGWPALITCGELGGLEEGQEERKLHALSFGPWEPSTT